MTSRLKPKDFNVLKRGGSYIVGDYNPWERPIYGLDPNDYAEFHVYDLNDTLLKSGVTNNFIDGTSIRVKPGDDLRQIGFMSGKYKVTYNFFRRLAGSNDTVLTYTSDNKSGQIYTGPTRITNFPENEYTVTDDGRIYTKVTSGSVPEELDLKEYKYYIHEISPSRTEIRLIPIDIDQDKYKQDFEKLYSEPKIYTPDTSDGYGDCTFATDNTNTTLEFNLKESDIGFTEEFVSGQIEIKNAFVVGYNTELKQPSLVQNSILNSSGDDIDLNWNPTSEIWNINLHEDAIKPKHWSSGINSKVDTPQVGYHAKWVYNEGRNNSTCIKFIDKNDQFTNSDGNSLEHRWLGISQQINNLQASGISVGDTITVSWYQKSDVEGKGAVVGLYHTIGDFNDEIRPTEPPNGLDLSEPVPTGVTLEEAPSGTLSPGRRWVQTGTSLVLWSLRFNPESGSVSPLGGWTWTGSQWERIQPTKNRGFEENISNIEDTVVESVDTWERKTFTSTVGPNWDLDSDFSLYIYGHHGNNGILLVDDIKMTYNKAGETVSTPIYESYKTEIVSVQSKNRIVVKESWYEQALKVGHQGNEIGINSENYPFKDWNVVYKTNDPTTLTTLLNFDNNVLSLVTNYKKDDVTVSQYPYSIIYKVYEPIPTNVSVGDFCYVVREMAPSKTIPIDLINFVEEDVSTVVLRSPNLHSIDSPITRGETYYKTISDILTNDTDVSKKLEDRFLSGSFSSAKLNIDYRRFENFINFSSVKRRIKNFKTKLEQIESNSALSASYAQYNNPVTSSLTTLIEKYEKANRKIINEFDDFEQYMYTNSSSYYSGSSGEFFDNAWPKTSGTGTVSSPYIVAPTTSSMAVTWYNNQITSASLYDTNNQNRLSYQLPAFIKEDSANEDFLNFVDMISHQFDNIWSYINGMSDIYNRSDKLDVGISKDLLYTVAKSFGWELKSGKSLIELPRYSLGYRVTGSSSQHDIYSTVAEEDISKEIWSRIINNMPYFLKTKGTIRSLRGLISCYGIPPTILRIKEYGGPDITDNSPTYEIERKFTKAIDFKGSQYVQTTWSDDTISGRKPDTIEFRFKTSTGSNQTLFQAGNAWAVRLKDNGSNDNYGHLSFMLSGSDGYVEISSSQLPIYDGEFYSGMLRRTILSPNTSSFTNDGGSTTYGANKLVLSDVSKFPSSGKINVKNSNNNDITLTYSGKNSGTNELLNISGWPKRQIKSSDTTQNVSPISTGSLVTPLFDPNSDNISQDIKYELFIKKYDSGRNKIQYESVSSIIISGSMGLVSSSYNATFSGSQTMYIGGNNSTFGSQFSGSMMEFRYWTTPLNESAFNNHVASPKAYNGNHVSASYTDLVLRYSFDDNINHSVSSTVRDSSANQTYTQNGTAVGFSNEINYSSVEEVQNSFIPNIGALRRTSNKVRIESNKLVGNLNVNSRAEKSSFDTAPLDSNKAGIYFAPTDVINEDIILSVADLNFDNYIGDPRDVYKTSYRELNNISDKYWQKYTTPNNFWAYLRLIRYYDQSMFDQLKTLIPARTKAKFGVLVEPNILERPKNVVIKQPSFENLNYDGSINMSLLESDNIELSMSGDYIFNEGSSSYSIDTLQEPTLYKLDRYSIYSTASLSNGTPLYVFEEGVQPFISASRLSEHNQEIQYFYSSSVSKSLGLAYSSSYISSEFDNHTDEFTNIFNLFYGGSMQTSDTTIDGTDPVIVTSTSPTVLVTKEPGESKLEVR